MIAPDDLRAWDDRLDDRKPVTEEAAHVRVLDGIFSAIGLVLFFALMNWIVCTIGDPESVAVALIATGVLFAWLILAGIKRALSGLLQWI